MEPNSNSGEHAQLRERPKGKLRRSCEACRDFKVRCHPSGKTGDPCQRCTKERKNCIFLEAKSRPKRTQSSRLRVNELEQKLDSLIAMIAPDGDPGVVPSEASSVPEVSIPEPITVTDSLPLFQPIAPSQSQHFPKTPNTCQAFGNHTYPLPSMPSFTIFDDLQDVISRFIITEEKAEESVQYFRSRASNSPFVIISPDASINYLRRQKPFLLLTVLAMATLDNLKLQKLLDQEIRNTLGHRVFMSGEKSLDLLQGLLVYLTWHHLFFEPEHQQLYQLSQLAVSMAIDLDITTSEQHRRQTPSKSFNLLSLIAGNSADQALSQDVESKRTFLGCYYISSTVCIGLRKPNNMKYSNYTEECCQFLATARQAGSDALIPYFIRMQKIADDINQTFNYDGHQEITPLVDTTKAEILIKTFRQQLAQLKRTFSAEVWKHDMLIMAYYHLRTFLNEVGFHRVALPPSNLMSDQASYRTWSSSITRSEVLINCLSAAKDYLERYISLPTEVLLSFSFADIVKLIYNVLILKLFATWAQDDTSLDASHIQKIANMAFYMEALVLTFERMSKLGRDRGILEDYTFVLAQLFRTYESRARDGMAKHFSESNFPDMSIMQMLPLLSSPAAHLAAPTFSQAVTSSVISSSVINSDDQWADMADMLVPWSPSLDPHDVSTEALST